MKPIPRKLREQMALNPFMGKCIHIEKGGCGGVLTWEHAIIIAGKQVNESWAIVPCCWKHNVGVTGKKKRFNRFVAMIRWFRLDLRERMRQIKKYPKYDFINNYQLALYEFSLNDYPELEARIESECEWREEETKAARNAGRADKGR